MIKKVMNYFLIYYISYDTDDSVKESNLKREERR